MKKRRIFVMPVIFVMIAATVACQSACDRKEPPTAPEASPSHTLIQTPEPSPEEKQLPSVEPIPSPASTQEAESFPYSFPANQTVFDFSVLSEDVFPRGKWTVNQLIDKYGKPEEVIANYLSGYDIVFVSVHFVGFSVHFIFEYADSFSFYSKKLEEKNYSAELNEEDMNMELEILYLMFDDPDILFPYDIKIGHCTKAQVMELYPTDTAYQWKDEKNDIDLLSYYYDFSDEDGNLPEYDSYGHGYIEYLFDKNEVLRQVTVQWFDFDL